MTYWNLTIPPPKTGRNGRYFAKVEKRFIFCQRADANLDIQKVTRMGMKLTVKNESPGPKIIEGLMIVEVGSAERNAFSPSAFVRALSSD